MAKSGGEVAAGRPGAVARFLAPGFLLPFVIFWSCLDRTIVLPLIPVIAEGLDTTVVAAGMAVTAHALAYSFLQLLWGPLSTRWGRPKVLWVSTAIAGAANIVASAAPSMAVFVMARALSGGAFAAAFAATLTYFGDTLPPLRRPAAMSNLATASAIGLAGGSLAAGALDQWVDWRWTYAVYGVITILLAAGIMRLPDPGNHHGEQVLDQLRSLAHNCWALAIYGLVALEGFLLIGVFNFLPVALQQAGESVFVSGLVIGAFGVAVVVVSQAMKLFVQRVRAQWLLAAAGGFAVTAFLVLVPRVTAFSVLVASALMGVAWALAHTTLQTWMADAAAGARALGMTFFSITLMLGGAVGAMAGSFAAGNSAFAVLFIVSAAGSAVFGLASMATRARFPSTESQD